MSKIYLIIAICVMVVGAYFYGVNIADAKCEMRNAQQNLQISEQNIKNTRIVNDKVYKTGVGDIRRILFDKYTISE